jgi:hypothetical protein
VVNPAIAAVGLAADETEEKMIQNELFIYIGSIIVFLWGITHLLPTKAILQGFGPLSSDNQQILAMEWIAEGLTLCFLGVMAYMITWFGGLNNPIVVLVTHMIIAMLILMAMLSFTTGARTAIIPIKVCPFVKILVALLLFLGTMK